MGLACAPAAAKPAQKSRQRDAADVDDAEGVRQGQARIDDPQQGDVAGPAPFDQPLLKQHRQRRQQEVQRIGPQFECHIGEVVIEGDKQERTHPHRQRGCRAPADPAEYDGRSCRQQQTCGL